MKRRVGLLAALSALSVSVAAVSAQQTPAPGATQDGGPLGSSWWLWILLILLVLFLIWWLLRRRPDPTPPPSTGRAAVYEAPGPPATPAVPTGGAVVPPASLAMPDEEMPAEPPEATFDMPSRSMPEATFDMPSGGMPDVSLAAESAMAYDEPDDLKRIEGIGPRIAAILNAAGITTFEQLSVTPVERLREILVAAELRGSFGDPSSWSEQARLAAAGLWDDLQNMQDHLRGGR